MYTLEQHYLVLLYKLLTRLERGKDQNTVAALRWAIFTLENMKEVSQ